MTTDRTALLVLLVTTALSLVPGCDEGEAGHSERDAAEDTGGTEPVRCDPDTFPDCEGPFHCPYYTWVDGPLTISRESVCDGIADCARAEDEANCPELENMLCDRDDDGALSVYQPQHVCDGHAECFRADDERDCPDSFLCPRYEIGGGHTAIPRSQVCDGIWQCTIDEFDCPNVTTPFVCPEGRAIDRKFMCDQAADCAEQHVGDSYVSADEVDPSCHQYACKRTYTETSDRAPCSLCKPWYIPETKVCDGFADCQYGDDEQSCR